MASSALLFLDFDGVLCDSLPECLVSSWIAYHHLMLRDLPKSMPIDFLRRFHELRPFIRSGEDYIILQAVLEEGVVVENQIDFDRRIERTGKSQMASYKEAFYKARQELLSQEPDFWLSLNPLFPALKAALVENRNNKRIHILSTKRIKFILEILEANGIEFDSANVIDSGNENKAGRIGQILDRQGEPHALFIDDQIDHLLGITDKRIDAFLAEWGYVKAEWVKNTGRIRSLTMEEGAALIRGIKTG